MLLWVNLHGGWLFGLALLGIYTFAAFVDRVRARKDDEFAAIRAWQRARAMASAFAVSAVATLVNPYGWRLHAHIYRYLGDRYLMNHIDEFRSPDFHGWSQRSFAIILALVLVAFAGNRRSGTNRSFGQSGQVAAQPPAGRAAGGVCGILFVAQSSGFFDAAGADRGADFVGELRFIGG